MFAHGNDLKDVQKRSKCCSWEQNIVKMQKRSRRSGVVKQKVPAKSQFFLLSPFRWQPLRLKNVDLRTYQKCSSKNKHAGNKLSGNKKVDDETPGVLCLWSSYTVTHPQATSAKKCIDNIIMVFNISSVFYAETLLYTNFLISERKSIDKIMNIYMLKYRSKRCQRMKKLPNNQIVQH